MSPPVSPAQAPLSSDPDHFAAQSPPAPHGRAEVLPFVPEPALRELPPDRQPPPPPPPAGHPQIPHQQPYGVTYGTPYQKRQDPYGPEQYGSYGDDLLDEDTQGWPPDLPPGYEPIPIPPQAYQPERTPRFDQQRQHAEVAPPQYEPSQYEPPQYEPSQYEPSQYEPPQYDWPADALTAQTPVHGAPAVHGAPVQHVPPPASHAAPAIHAAPTPLDDDDDDEDPEAFAPEAVAGPPQMQTPQPPTPLPPTQQPPAQQSPAPRPSAHQLVPERPALQPTGPGLPQRVPAEPDVPAVPADEAARRALVSQADGPDLARIAERLRHEEDDVQLADERPDGFDIPAVIKAVRSVRGVRSAALRENPGGVHTLRLELYDDADAGWVSRAVARLLNERMGLAAEPSTPTPPPATYVPGRPYSPYAPPRGPLPPAPPGPSPAPGRDTARRHQVSGVRRAPEAEPGDEAQRIAALPSARLVLDQVEVSTTGIDAFVEVRLRADGRPATGVARGPAVDGYVLRLSAEAAASAIDQLLDDPLATATARCFIEHAAVVPLGSCEVAVVVLLLVCDGLVEQMTGSAVVSGDARQAVVRATLAAVNRRLEGLLP
jgi:hypothetical protein